MSPELKQYLFKSASKAFIKFFVPCSIVILIFLTFISMNVAFIFTDKPGCFFRYPDSNNQIINSTTVTLMANAEYNAQSKNIKWTKITITGEQKQIDLEVSGTVSLCLAKLPKNNIYQNDNLRKKNGNETDNERKIVIPREGFNDYLIIPIVIKDWSNLSDTIEKHDKVKVILQPSTLESNYVVHNPFDPNNPFLGKCKAGERAYHPVCGRYAMYGGEYISSCNMSTNYSSIRPIDKDGDKVEKVCTALNLKIEDYSSKTDDQVCCKGFTECCNCEKLKNPEVLKYFDTRTDGSPKVCGTNGCCKRFEGTKCIEKCNGMQDICKEPIEQDSFGYRTKETKKRVCTPSSNCIGYDTVTRTVCVCKPFLEIKKETKDTPKVYVHGSPNNITNAEAQNPNHKEITGYCIEESGKLHEQKFWCTADDAAGLKYRLTSTEEGKWVNPPDNERLIYIKNSEVNKNDVGNLQFKLHNVSGPTNSGGFLIGIQHTKCVRENGETINNIGGIEYLITSTDTQENQLSEEKAKIIQFSNKKGQIDIPQNIGKNLTLWMRVKNNKTDYADSMGSYSVMIKQSIKSNNSNTAIAKFVSLRTKFQDFGVNIFKNITCNNNDDVMCKLALKEGKRIPGCEKSCLDFLFLIHVCLSLYITIYGLSIITGYARIEIYDAIIRVTKIIIVSGLLSNTTINFFTTYVLPIAYNGIDYIIANISGYDVSKSEYGTHPFSFLSVVTDRLFSRLFWMQVLTTIFSGAFGIFYFFFLIRSGVGFIKIIIKCLASYTMSILMITFLIALAPIFLMMILFRTTYSLFVNWVKFLCFYTIEPVILFAGASVFIQLFTVYLDRALDYSVCWKCKLQVSIWCLKWFMPWGSEGNFSFDNQDEDGGLTSSVVYIFAITLLHQTCSKYVDAVGSFTARLIGLTDITSSGQISADLTDQAKKGASKVANYVIRQAKSAYSNAKKALQDDVRRE
ncbi:Type IV secretion system protein VirB6 [Rickettsiales endosymbiont of Paramecium tredecaurelia]|uniref:type IV secretion system protein n=1 Tax=Candidatus Sarmatiella mevalonica TaxID=2770581 RepID=UPI001921B5D7|nr:type IV secretion system protein [Candidatus Sarmatiella mevalonica]MBL3284234.1 Type IV secretion system protein VirB6 [Candidatus Sarmatiella mevalonica]